MRQKILRRLARRNPQSIKHLRSYCACNLQIEVRLKLRQCELGFRSDNPINGTVIVTICLQALLNQPHDRCKLRGVALERRESVRCQKWRWGLIGGSRRRVSTMRMPAPILAPVRGRPVGAIDPCARAGCFDPRAREGATSFAPRSHGSAHSFDPRPCEVSDAPAPAQVSAPKVFRSTPP